MCRPESGGGNSSGFTSRCQPVGSASKAEEGAGQLCGPCIYESGPALRMRDSRMRQAAWAQWMREETRASTTRSAKESSPTAKGRQTHSVSPTQTYRREVDGGDSRLSGSAVAAAAASAPAVAAAERARSTPTRPPHWIQTLRSPSTPSHSSAQTYHPRSLLRLLQRHSLRRRTTLPTAEARERAGAARQTGS